jgi:hypothetical protein
MIISLVLGLIAIILKFISFYDNYIILDDYHKVILTINYFNFLNNLCFRIKTNIYYYTGYRISPDANQYIMNTSLLSEICDCIKSFFNYFGNNTKTESSPPRKESRVQDEPIHLDNLMDFLQEYEEKQAREQYILAEQKAKEVASMESAFASLKKEKKMKIEQQQQLNKAQENKNKLDEQILESASSSALLQQKEEEINNNEDILPLMQENKEIYEYDTIDKVVLEEVVDDAVAVKENTEESDLLATNLLLEKEDEKEDEEDDATNILSL